MRYAVTFVCQGGELERKAMLLAASLRRYLQWDCELVAAIPTPASRWREPASSTLAFLRRLDVRTTTIENRIADDYPIGNKVSCLSIATAADVTVFMDSDLLCLRPVTDDPICEQDFCAKPADLDTSGVSGDLWQQIYASEGLTMPPERVRATVSDDEMPPYFNSGFIAVRSGLGFGEAWVAACRRIDRDPRIATRRPFLDQLALPVAVRKLGLAWACLSENDNFPCHLKDVPERSSIRFAHYHRVDTLLRTAALRRCVESLAIEHPALACVFAASLDAP